MSQNNDPAHRRSGRYRDGLIVVAILLALVVFNLTCNAAIGINVLEDSARIN